MSQESSKVSRSAGLRRAEALLRQQRRLHRAEQQLSMVGEISLAENEACDIVVALLQKEQKELAMRARELRRSLGKKPQ